jgi:hypothetical protein
MSTKLVDQDVFLIRELARRGCETAKIAKLMELPEEYVQAVIDEKIYRGVTYLYRPGMKFSAWVARSQSPDI